MEPSCTRRKFLSFLDSGRKHISRISPWQRVGRFEKQKNEHFVLVLYVE
jgi:hypothetical protein